MPGWCFKLCGSRYLLAMTMRSIGVFLLATSFLVASYAIAFADSELIVPLQNLSTEEHRPYLSGGKPVERGSGAWRDDYGRSILRYNSAADCVAEADSSSPTIDVSNVNWRKIKGANSFDVCAFRIVTSLASRDDVITWLRSQDFEILAQTQKGEITSDLNRRDVHLLLGIWTVEQYREHRPSLLAYLGFELIQRVNLTIAYDEGGEIYAVIFSEGSK